MWGARKYLGMDIDADLGTLIVGTVASAVAYLVPPHAQDIIRPRRVNIAGFANLSTASTSGPSPAHLP
jgi:hypothetical protein